MRNIERGLSLLELLVVLSIVGILAIISIPSVVSIVQNHRLSGTGEKLYYDLQYARSEAVKNNTNIYVSFQSGNSWCYGISSGATCNCSIANNCNLGATVGGSQQLTLSITGLSANTVQFEGTRGAANASGSVTLAVSGQATPLITISIGMLGGLQMCSTGIGGYAGC